MSKSGNGNDPELQAMCYTREIHFPMFDEETAIIKIGTFSSKGIGRIVIRNIGGKTEVHVMGNGNFKFKGIKDFPKVEGADYFISNPDLE